MINLKLSMHNKLGRMALLISILLIAALPHVMHLPYWATVYILMICFFGWMTKKQKKLPGKTIRLALVFIAIIGLANSYGTVLGRDAGVSMLVIMLSLKLLEIKSKRDEIVFIFIGYFLVITNFLFSQSILMGTYMFAVVIWNTTVLILLNRVGHNVRIIPSLKTSAIMLGQAIPLMLVLFILFPRIPGPLWSLPKDAHSGVTGLSDSMTPGNISNLIRSDKVAFRVSFKSDIPANELLYWRGPVLSDFNGLSWTSGKKNTSLALAYEPIGSAITYTVTMEPHNKNWLYAIDLPADAPANSKITSDYLILSNKPVIDRIQYQASSYTSYKADSVLTLHIRYKNLLLPKQSNPRTREWVNLLKQKYKNKQELVKHILLTFRNENFTYTLNPPLLYGDTIDSFLFDSRKGFCEHYASSFVFLMRAAGIPARVVTGYQGGEYNEIGNYLIVRQSDAHAWTEIWLQGKGWVRIDPTSAVSPARIENGIDAAIPVRESTGGLIRSDNQLFRNMVLLWDSFDNRWNQWILGYGDTRQLEFLSYLGFKKIDWADMTFWLTIISIIIITIIAIIMRAGKYRNSKDATYIIYQKFCNKLSSCGISRKPYEGPKDFGKRASALRPDLRKQIGNITNQYIALRYGNQSSRDGLKYFRILTRQFNPARRNT
jgi:transglutaminase-like putative cysteine protease